MNRLQLKALSLSIITEIKHGYPLASNTGRLKKQIKIDRGLKPNTSNKILLDEIGKIYHEAMLGDEFDSMMEKFNMV